VHGSRDVPREVTTKDGLRRGAPAEERDQGEG